jgi:hypothetical protein
MNMNPNNDFDVNAQGVEVLANNGDLPSVLFDQDPFGDEDAKAEENNSPSAGVIKWLKPQPCWASLAAPATRSSSLVVSEALPFSLWYGLCPA